MITRQFGKLLRGSATPFQILAACVIASFIAFIPGFSQAPGLLLAWLAVLVIVNANLFLAGLVGVGAKLIALLATPLSFAVGRWLLEGPMRGFFETLVNAPVLAWFGFEYPLVTGGQLVALVFGLAVGIAIVKVTRGTWHKLAALEKDSAAFNTWSNKGWVKFAAFIFVGGLKGKKSFEELSARKIGNPVRMIGLVLVVLLAVLGFVGAKFFDDAIVTSVVRSSLEKVNGATVDLERASLDPVAGSLVLQDLALCDPDDVGTNLFAAKNVAATVSTSDLLRKRATVDLVSITGATHGAKRAVPGRRLAPPPEEDDGEGWKVKMPDAKSLDDLLKNSEVWKERLATVRRWMEKFSGGESSEAVPAADGTGPSYEDILRERIAREGYAAIRDDGLVQKSPTLLVRRIEAAEVTSTAMAGETLNIVAENLSTQPQLVDAAPSVSIRSASGTFATSLGFSPKPTAASQAQLEFLWKGLSVDALAGHLKTGDKPLPLSGGTVDIHANGVAGLIDSMLPLTLVLHDTQLSIGGSAPTPVENLELSVIELHGPIDSPAIKLDPDGWTKALASVAKGEAKRRLTGELEKMLGGKGAGTDGKSSDLEKAAGGLLEGVLGGKKPKNPEPKPEPAPSP